jgi:hypothetical protein
VTVTVATAAMVNDKIVVVEKFMMLMLMEGYVNYSRFGDFVRTLLP